MLIQLKNAAATLAAGKPLVFSRGVYGVCRAFSGGVGCWRTLFPGISARHEPRNVRKDQKDRTGTEHALNQTGEGQISMNHMNLRSFASLP